MAIFIAIETSNYPNFFLIFWVNGINSGCKDKNASSIFLLVRFLVKLS